MPGMYQAMAFWAGVIALLALAGGMEIMALLFFAQTAFFLALSYMNLSERGYIYVFAGYLSLFFVGFTYYTTFYM